MTDSLDPKLAELVKEAWRIFNENKDLTQDGKKIIVGKPILFFGDYEAYSKSQTKIITVGKNPSLEEFPEAETRFRFSQSEPGNDIEREEYVHALNSYFRGNPYSRWFSSFNQILNSMDCGYGGIFDKKANTALHTDLLSPLATNPTWSMLKQFSMNKLLKDGPNLWHNLIRFLNPNLILVSTKKSDLEWIPELEFVTTLDIQKRPRPEVYKMNLGGGKSSFLLFGSYNQLGPFRYYNDKEIEIIGAEFKKIADMKQRGS